MRRLQVGDIVVMHDKDGTFGGTAKQDAERRVQFVITGKAEYVKDGWNAQVCAGFISSVGNRRPTWIVEPDYVYVISGTLTCKEDIEAMYG